MRLSTALAWACAITDATAKAVVAPRADAVAWQPVESQHEQRDTSENTNEFWKRRGGGGGGGGRSGGSSSSSGSSSSGSSSSSSGSSSSGGSSGGYVDHPVYHLSYNNLHDGEVSASRLGLEDSLSHVWN
jgi:hypothetical protein